LDAVEKKTKIIKDEDGFGEEIGKEGLDKAPNRHILLEKRQLPIFLM